LITHCETKLGAEELGRALRSVQFEQDRTAIRKDVEPESKETAALSFEIDHTGDIREYTGRGLESQSQTVFDRLHLGAPRPERSQDLAALVELGGRERTGDGDVGHD
jgi:hypothetical protein